MQSFLKRNNKIIKLLIICFFVFSQTPESQSRDRLAHSCFKPVNKTCQAIAELKPTMNLDKALQLSNHFYNVARKYGLPAYLLVSIAMQESGMRLDIVRAVKGLTLGEDGIYRPASVDSDFCMMQINASNILKFNLDAARLLSDPFYCIQAGAVILKDSEKRFAKSENAWWTRYNASSKIHRKNYHEHILKHWRKIDPQAEHPPIEIEP